MTVIADDHGVLSLGGVIGGESTGCTEATTDVFIEAALFDPLRTAATGRKLNIQSDARYRFERGLDPEFVARRHRDRDAADPRAVRRRAERGRRSPARCRIGGAAIACAPTASRTLGGVDVPAAEQRRILEALGCRRRAERDGVFAVEPPSWRGDIEGEADLVEEVLRVHGYDHIPAVPLPRETALPKPALDAGAAARRLRAPQRSPRAAWSRR